MSGKKDKFQIVIIEDDKEEISKQIWKDKNVKK